MAPINKARGKRGRIPSPSFGAKEREHFTPSSSKRLLKIVPSSSALLNPLFFTVRWMAFIFPKARRTNMRTNILGIITLIFLRIQIIVSATKLSSVMSVVTLHSWIMGRLVADAVERWTVDLVAEKPCAHAPNCWTLYVLNLSEEA